jgi:hypothetical protein
MHRPHLAALLALLAAACSTLGDTAADDGTTTASGASIEVVEVPAEVDGVEVPGTILSAHACAYPYSAAGRCEPAAFFNDRGTVYVEGSGYWRLVVLR